MDFVVVGLGLGALGMLAGVFLLGWAAGRWERAALRAATADERAFAAATAMTRRDTGQAILGASSAVLIATVGALAGSLDDQTGAFFVTTTVTVAGLCLLVWGYLYRVRHPMPRRPRGESEVGSRRTGVSTATAGAVPPAAAVSPERVVRLPALRDGHVPSASANGAGDHNETEAIDETEPVRLVPLPLADVAPATAASNGHELGAEAAGAETEDAHEVPITAATVLALVPAAGDESEPASAAADDAEDPA